MTPATLLRRTAPLAAAALCALLPATADAGGTLSATPCVKLVPTNSGQDFRRNQTVEARFNVSNCAAAPITVGTPYTSTSTAWSSTPIVPAPLPCAGPSGNGGVLTLRPGETRSVRISIPPTGCPLGPGGAILRVDVKARSAGITRATATAYYGIRLETI